MKTPLIERRAREIVALLSQSGSFNSHDVISYWAINYPMEYAMIVNAYHGNRRSANSVISNYVRRHFPNEIQSAHSKSNTFNVNGHKTPSRDWLSNN